MYGKEVVIIPKGSVSHRNVSHVLKWSIKVDIGHRLGMNSSQKLNFQLVKSTDKTQVEESLSYIIVLQINSII